jgi:amino-acid N-acetyltransferase
MNASDFIDALRAAAPYVHSHNGRVVVLAISGEAAARDDFDQLIYDVALLHSLGVKLVLVHGARPQIEALVTAKGLPSTYVGNLRVTDRATLECVKAAVGSLRMDIEARLSTSLASTPMGGARLRVSGGNWVTARPVGVREGVDHQHTGEVRRLDVQTIGQVLEQDRIALISPVGYSPTGEIFNLRAEDVAVAVATALSADKLIFVVASDPDHWSLADDTGDVGQLSLAQGEALLAEAWHIDDQDRSYLNAALAAGRAGVQRIHLVGAGTHGGLLRELYTRDGVGLMIHADADYEATRQAGIEDIGGILNLIQPLEASGILVARSREQLELEVDRFTVMVRDGTVIACAALIPFHEEMTGEFACVAVHPDYRRGGRAAVLLERIESQARRMGLKRLFSLTTHIPHWFIEHGFLHGDVADLPQHKQSLYNYRRNSLVLIKNL